MCHAGAQRLGSGTLMYKLYKFTFILGDLVIYINESLLRKYN